MQSPGGKAGEEPEDFCAPCGVCRQVMREFCGDAFVIILAKPGEEKVYTLKDLLPQSFSPRDVLGEKRSGKKGGDFVRIFWTLSAKSGTAGR